MIFVLFYSINGSDVMLQYPTARSKVLGTSTHVVLFHIPTTVVLLAFAVVYNG